jgi:hypothetical protein
MQTRQSSSRFLYVQPMTVTQEDEVCHSVPVMLRPVSALGLLSRVVQSSSFLSQGDHYDALCYTDCTGWLTPTGNVALHTWP